MQEILLHIEKMNKSNFDNFGFLFTQYRESERTRAPDSTILTRLKEDAFSKNPKYEVYLGKIGLEWVAYVIIIMSYSTVMALPSLSVDELFVLDSFRNLGIGLALFEFCIRTAKKRGCGKLELIVPDWNKKAKNFFEFNKAVPADMTCYQIGPFKTKLGVVFPPGKWQRRMLSGKRIIRLARLN